MDDTINDYQPWYSCGLKMFDTCSPYGVVLGAMCVEKFKEQVHTYMKVDEYTVPTNKNEITK